MADPCCGLGCSALTLYARLSSDSRQAGCSSYGALRRCVSATRSAPSGAARATTGSAEWRCPSAGGFRGCPPGQISLVGGHPGSTAHLPPHCAASHLAHSTSRLTSSRPPGGGASLRRASGSERDEGRAGWVKKSRVGHPISEAQPTREPAAGPSVICLYEIFPPPAIISLPWAFVWQAAGHPPAGRACRGTLP
jgi:hypothetical protein